jgi:hypothetical protein
VIISGFSDSKSESSLCKKLFHMVPSFGPIQKKEKIARIILKKHAAAKGVRYSFQLGGRDRSIRTTSKEDEIL